MVAGSTSETEIIESYRFSFWCMGRSLAARRRPVASRFCKGGSPHPQQQEPVVTAVCVVRNIFAKFE
jgi:hypothetical protein